MWAVLILAAVAGAQTTRDAAGKPYFPSDAAREPICLEGETASPRRLDAFVRAWYGRHLRAAGEGSLAARVRDRATRRDGVLRFTWLRSFDRPIVVRVEGLATRHPRLVAHELSGAGGYDPGGVARRVDRALTGTEAAGLRRLARPAILFATPPCAGIGADGAQWIVEAVDATGYHIADRWSPQSGAVRDVGLALIGLTGWHPTPVY